MFKYAKIALIAIGMMATIGSVTAQKIGHVDFQGLVGKMPEKAEAEIQMKSYQDQLTAALQKLQTEYQTKVQRLQTDTTMPRSVQEDLYNEITTLEKRITDFQTNAQNDLTQKENELIAPIVDKVNAAIEKVAKAEGFEYIIEAQVLYYKGGTDVTPLVEKELGITQ